MRTLEIRRHSHRHIPQPHLSQIGVDLARRVGNEMGRFDRVITSAVPRAFETAIAMGYAVDEQIEPLGLMSNAVTAVVQWNAGFTDDAACGYCEGARLTFDGESLANVEMLRIEQPRL